MKRKGILKLTAAFAASALLALVPMTAFAAEGEAEEPKVFYIDARKPAQETQPLEVKPVAAHWETDEHGTRYILTDGTYLSNVWLQINNGSWYYLDGDGYQVKGWQKIDEKDYYFEQDGHMLIGWQKIGEDWYFFEFEPDSSRGQMYVERTTPNGRIADEEGVLF